ncbi:endophilin-A2 isoform X1 [Rhinatrema bivittatum]|uniref:endophilin-A2 isoform X1 n=1 Tax=Rhinatrema bivittatum TaxID=194408 RepID=UPI00112E3728|nr:endophilin-A2 isoform X1 [Rhinatrema bivittatum]
MSVAGLKKQFYKASQAGMQKDLALNSLIGHVAALCYRGIVQGMALASHKDMLVSEKVGGAEGTKLDDDFKEMEKKVDVTSKAVAEVLTKTIEYLQPNPASRAKLSMLNTVSKIRGQVKNPGYPQPEGLLGESMIRYGKELGDESNFGDALLDAGESMKRLAEVKDSLDIEVKQNFIDPLQNLCDKDLKEIQHHLKKLEGRRLDFDYKKKRQGKIPDEELRQAMEKFEESKEVAETSMHNLLETDIEQVSQLSALVDAQLDYHKQAVQILEELTDKLKDRIREASSRPKREYKPKLRENYDFGEASQSNGGFSCNASVRVPGREVPASSSFRFDKPTRTPSTRSTPLDQPCCKALYDFEPENDGELGFREGDIITLTNQIDENWYEGMINGQSGFFPLNYVEVLVPLPQ